MADSIFEHPRLVSIYDSFDNDRQDLDHYVSLAKELSATSVVDVGCGTGCLALRLVQEGLSVVGVDPAGASIEAAKRKTNNAIWVVGTASDLPVMTVDLAVMTGNVAQVFCTDLEWDENLTAIHRVLRPDGHLVFEVREPSKRAWQHWTREKSYRRIHVPEVGFVEGWCEVTNVSGELVSFRWTYVFESDRQILTSDSTLRFREREAIERALKRSGYRVKEVRDAPDRPGQELVFIASRE